MCASHQEASSTAAAGRPSSPISGRGPRDETAAAISNRGSVANSAAVTVRTAPSSSASRTRVPDTLTTTFGVPPTRIRSPTPTRRRRTPLTAARPRAQRSSCPAARPPGQLPTAAATSGETAPATPPAGPRPAQRPRTGPARRRTPPTAPPRSPAPDIAGAGNATATARSRPAPGQDPLTGGTPSPPPDTRTRSARTSPRPEQGSGHQGGHPRPPRSRQPGGRRSPAHAAGPAPACYASTARTAATIPPAPQGRSPSTSDDHVPATTRTPREPPSWRSTTSPRSSATPSRTGTAVPPAPPRTARHHMTTAARAPRHHQQPETPARTVHPQRPPPHQQHPSPSTQPSQDQEQANSSGKTSRRAASTGKRPPCMSRDTCCSGTPTFGSCGSCPVPLKSAPYRRIRPIGAGGSVPDNQARPGDHGGLVLGGGSDVVDGNGVLPGVQVESDRQAELQADAAVGAPGFDA